MRILHSDAEGGLAVTIPAPKFLAELQKKNPQATEAQLLEFIANKDVGGTFEVVLDSDVPSDRTFRNAWEHDTSAAPEKVRTNMTKAKVIAHEMRRATREEAYAPYDKVVANQIGTPETQQAAKDARDIIRDADAIKQLDIDAASDEATLKALVV